MSKHVLVTQLSGSIQTTKLSIPIDRIVDINTSISTSKTQLSYLKNTSLVTIDVLETSSTLSSRINSIIDGPTQITFRQIGYF